MPVMMTSSAECCLAAREDFVVPLFDFFRAWPDDLRGFMNWIVASSADPRFAFRIAKRDSGFLASLSRKCRREIGKSRLSPP
jgi:hypothetical protein